MKNFLMIIVYGSFLMSNIVKADADISIDNDVNIMVKELSILHNILGEYSPKMESKKQSLTLENIELDKEIAHLTKKVREKLINVHSLESDIQRKSHLIKENNTEIGHKRDLVDHYERQKRSQEDNCNKFTFNILESSCSIGSDELAKLNGLNDDIRYARRKLDKLNSERRLLQNNYDKAYNSYSNAENELEVLNKSRDKLFIRMKKVKKLISYNNILSFEIKKLSSSLINQKDFLELKNKVEILIKNMKDYLNKD